MCHVCALCFGLPSVYFIFLFSGAFIQLLTKLPYSTPFHKALSSRVTAVTGLDFGDLKSCGDFEEYFESMEELKKGWDIQFIFLKPDILITKVAGLQLGLIQSQLLSSALQDVYFGTEAVSLDAREKLLREYWDAPDPLA